MKPKIILCLALILSSGLFGCSNTKPNQSVVPIRQSTCEVITNAISREDWNTLRGLAKPGMSANESIQKWEKYPVRVGKLVRVEKDSKYNLDGKPCTMYSFELGNKDGTPNPHWLQILVREEGGKSTLLDFWNFGW